MQHWWCLLYWITSLLTCYPRPWNKLDSITQQIIGYNKECQAISIFPLVPEKIYCGVGFPLMSNSNKLWEKYFKFHSSLIHFCVIISEEHSRQFSWKSNKSTYPINVEVTCVIANLNFLASKEIYSFLASFSKVCVNAVMLLTNKTQHGTSWQASWQRTILKFVGKVILWNENTS